MFSGNDFLRSFICFVLILFIAIPAYPEIKGREVIIELMDKTKFEGKLLTVALDEIRVYSDHIVEKIKTIHINRVGIKRRSFFGKSVLWGVVIGFTIGSVSSLNIQTGKEALFAQTRFLAFLFMAVICGVAGLLVGIVTGAITSMVSSRYRYYNYSKYSDAKKKWLLTRMNKFASL